MGDKQEFRKKVLQTHYDISSGNIWNLVLRTIVAKRLGVENYNDDELLGTIKYLEDKGYLKTITNVGDQITDSGIDEVENRFPNLFPKDKTGDRFLGDKSRFVKILKLLPEKILNQNNHRDLIAGIQKIPLASSMFSGVPKTGAFGVILKK